MSGFFYGWYLKSQSDTRTLAVIPAVHQTGRKHTCSIQIITDNNASTVEFPADAFRRVGRNIIIGKNYFGKKGIRLDVHMSDLTIKGRLRFGPPALPKYDIMGPFAVVQKNICGRNASFPEVHLCCR